MFYTPQREKFFARRFVWSYVSLAFLIVVFLGGYYIGANKQAPSSSLISGAGGEVKDKDSLPPYLMQDVDFDLFWDVWNIARERYLEQPVLDTQLFYGALSGIVNSLGDPYSAFLSPEITRMFTQELAGSFEGIGAEIGIRKDQLVIIAPLPDTPASRAGLKAGDQVLKIDEKETLGMPLDVAVSNIRGTGGTTVTLTIFREGWEDSKAIPIVRETINVKSVRLEEREGNIAHLKLIYFNETTPALFEQAARDILAKNYKGIVLDLRNNPGGFLEVAVRTASYFVTEGETVVWQEFQGGRKEAFRAEGQSKLRGIPLVVLINRGSASASEILAGALKDYGLAKLIGETSFGKGSVQTFEQLRGGSSIKITVAHWLTPKGEQIDKQGIVPDLEVETTKDDLNNGDDPVLDKALEVLRAELE
ncbi:S41 family peptidase [Candidatus Uhrbacteria bacterium]|nr:S41 family peptidase [Candidatus Uhrbacteria bacterium]